MYTKTKLNFESLYKCHVVARFIGLILLLLLTVHVYPTDLSAVGVSVGNMFSNGSDGGTANQPDLPGDLVVSYNDPIFGPKYTTSNQVSITISTGYAIVCSTPFAEQHLMVGTTDYYSFSVCNISNSSDTFSLSLNISSWTAWPVGLYHDDNQNASHQETETTTISSTTLLASGTTYYFFVKINVPPRTPAETPCIIALTIRDHDGLGTEDNWPITAQGDPVTGNDTVVISPTIYALRPPLPDTPSGLDTVLSSDKKMVTLSWTEGTKPGLYGYYIYASSVSVQDLLKATTYSVFVTSSPYTPTINSNNAANNEVWYYRIRAVNTLLEESEDYSMVAQAGEKPNLLVVCADANNNVVALITIPQEISTVLNKETNSYGADLLLNVNKETNQQANDIGIYEISVQRADNQEILPHLEFKQATVELKLFFLPQDLQAQNITTNQQAKDKLSVFYYNGIEWVNLGGRVVIDSVKNEMYALLKTNHFSKYKIAVSNIPSGFVLVSIAPPKTFAPTGPAEYSKVKFTLRHTAGLPVIARIFDLNAALIRSDLIMESYTEQDNIGNTILNWDGKDNSGQAVRGGIYIYQFECDKKIISGTIIVVR